MQAAMTFFSDGGFFMWPISLMMLLGTIFVLERFYMLFFVYYADGAALMQKIQRLILDNNIDEAIKVCNSKKRATIYQIFKAALVSYDRPPEEIQDHMQVAAASVLPKLQTRMPYISTIANVATLLGLLGTVMGLIMTFQAVGAVEGSQKQTLLATGISTALNTTAFGLFVAVPCSLAYGYLLNRINTMMDEIEHYSGRLLILIKTGSQYFEYEQKNAAPVAEKEVKE